MKMALADGKAPSSRILRPETMAEMLRPQNADVPMDLDFRIGLTWKLGVFVTSGSNESMSLVRTLAKTTLKRALKVKTGKVEQAPAKESEETVALSAEDLESIPGLSATEEGLVNVTARWNNLWFQLQGNELKLVPRPGQRFPLQFLLFGFMPFMLPQLDCAPWFAYSTVQGHTLVAAITEGKSRVMGEKVSPVPIPEAWMKRIGTWAPVNAHETDDPTLHATLHREGEFLMFQIVIGGSIAETGKQ